MNVGCIPKKLMHTAALLGELIKESTSYGWQLDTDLVKHSWVTMKNNIQSHIKKLNFGYKGQLRTVGVDYLNKLGNSLYSWIREVIDLFVRSSDTTSLLSNDCLMRSFYSLLLISVPQESLSAKTKLNAQMVQEMLRL